MMSRLARPPLLARLDAVLDHRLLLLLVPEGAAGPILLRRWAARRRPPSTCFSLCESDNQPERLLAHLVEALRPVAEAAGVRLAPPGAPVAADLESGLVDLINTLLEIRHETVLVLQNYHRIESPDVHRGLATFVDYLPPHVHLLITSAAEPPLPLAHWRVRRQMASISLVVPQPRPLRRTPRLSRPGAA